MSGYSFNALVLLANVAGWSGLDAKAAACVALAESSGNPSAVSANPDGGQNVGLMQLDTPGGVGAGYTVSQLKNPATNMAVAYQGWKRDGNSFKEWATASNGAAAAQWEKNVVGPYTSGLVGPGRDTAAAQVPDPFTGGSKETTSGGTGGAINSALGTAGSAVSATASLAGQASTVLEWLTTPAKLGRLMLVVVGLALAVAGLNAVARPVTAPLVDAGKKAAKAGAAVAAL